MTQPPENIREWLDAATAGMLGSERLDAYADAHLYIGQRLLRLWDVPIEAFAPTDVFSAEWAEEDEKQ